ncbi:DUF551 domain-containing protein [Enterobacter hormaechei]|uniref:DUF551 domain-containing protein n=1 Tax=Enterobacter hormaechei TaxID=158836 RepID=UPI00197F2E67|nr:DUF551 domain-containing protein [Enterobacter hormaechei]MBN4761919.1 DUF551 domain-containing protein [Enterobacter hormaechei]
MITLTKEWLLKTIAELEEERDATPGAVNEDAAMTLAAMKLALASLEAEAVALRDERSGSGGISKKPGFNDLQHGTPLYTVPPAPVFPRDLEEIIFSIVNAMADEKLRNDESELFSLAKKYIEHAKSKLSAAMLQSFGNSEQLNSPVTPDGWVACSERMPEVGVKVLCFPVNDEPIHATYNGQVWLQDISWSTSDEPIDNVISCNVFHWMPLPAAPQQEA